MRLRGQKAVLRLEEVRRKREERCDRYVWPLDQKRNLLAAEVDLRMRALIGTQQAAARRILGAINESNTFKYRIGARRSKPRST